MIVISYQTSVQMAKRGVEEGSWILTDRQVN